MSTVILKDFPNYSLTDKGVITNLTTGIVKRPSIGKNGYYVTDLSSSGKSKKQYIHRLLALNFLDNPNNFNVVNHLDGNKLNNELSNLEWTTHKGNIRHAYRIGLHKPKRRMSLQEATNYLYTWILTGNTLTALAEKLKTGISILSFRIREAAIAEGIEEEYNIELRRQKRERVDLLNVSQRLEHCARTPK